MNEFPPQMPSDEERMNPEERGLAEFNIKREAEKLAEALGNEAELNPEAMAAEFEGLAKQYELDHDVMAMYAITNLTADEAPRHTPREKAKEALIPLRDLLQKLKRIPGLPADRMEEIQSKYTYLSRSIGIIGNRGEDAGKVDHTRG